MRLFRSDAPRGPSFHKVRSGEKYVCRRGNTFKRAPKRWGGFLQCHHRDSAGSPACPPWSPAQVLPLNSGVHYGHMGTRAHAHTVGSGPRFMCHQMLTPEVESSVRQTRDLRGHQKSGKIWWGYNRAQTQANSAQQTFAHPVSHALSHLAEVWVMVCFELDHLNGLDGLPLPAWTRSLTRTDSVHRPREGHRRPLREAQEKCVSGEKAGRKRG